MRLLALSVLAFAFSTAASANVLWRGDYETGDLSQWAGVEGLKTGTVWRAGRERW